MIASSFSVIIPAYKVERYIKRSVTSVTESIRYAEAQLGPLIYEIIIVDDHSPDGTFAEAAALQMNMPHVYVVQTPKNSGAGAARNYGVRASHFDLIFFLDADDIFLPPHIYLCLKAMAENPVLHYVTTCVHIDEPIHPHWKAGIEGAVVFNMCQYRWVHDCIGGFPEEPAFKEFGGGEDVLYRMLLRYFITNKSLIREETIHHFRYPGSSLDKQYKKFTSPPEEALDDVEYLTEKQKLVYPDVLFLMQNRLRSFEHKLRDWVVMLNTEPR